MPLALERAALFGISEGAPMCMMFAATYPTRTSALVLYGSFARTGAGARLPQIGDAGRRRLAGRSWIASCQADHEAVGAELTDDELSAIV